MKSNLTDNGDFRDKLLILLLAIFNFLTPIFKKAIGSPVVSRGTRTGNALNFVLFKMQPLR